MYAIAKPSAAIEPPSASAPGRLHRIRSPDVSAASPSRAARVPRTAPSRPQAAGSQTSIDRGGILSPSRLQQEVEAHARHAEHQQRGVVAHEAALGGAYRRRAGTDQPGRAADERVVHDQALEGGPREAPG